MPSSGSLLKEKHVQFKKKIEDQGDLTASDQWLDSWKKTLWCLQKTISAMALPADKAAVTEFLNLIF